MQYMSAFDEPELKGQPVLSISGPPITGKIIVDACSTLQPANTDTHLIRRHERLVNGRLEKLRPAFLETTIAGMLDAYNKANPHLENSSAEMVTFADEQGITLEYMKSMLLSHSDLS